MKIKAFLGGYDNNLSYLIWCESTRIAGIIDAAVEITEILECIDSNNLLLEKVFITHTHFDHIKYLDDLKFREIAEILNMSEGGLKANYHHAVKKIEAYIKEI